MKILHRKKPSGDDLIELPRTLIPDVNLLCELIPFIVSILFMASTPLLNVFAVMLPANELRVIDWAGKALTTDVLLKAEFLKEIVGSAIFNYVIAKAFYP